MVGSTARLQKNSVQAGQSAIVVDLKNIAYISSAGFRVLLIANRVAAEKRSQLALCGVIGEVRRLFEIGDFTERFVICQTQADASANCGSEGSKNRVPPGSARRSPGALGPELQAFARDGDFTEEGAAVTLAPPRSATRRTLRWPGWPRGASRRALRPPCGLAPGRMDGLAPGRMDGPPCAGDARPPDACPPLSVALPCRVG
jgi:anti-anti-sigma factor